MAGSRAPIRLGSTEEAEAVTGVGLHGERDIVERRVLRQSEVIWNVRTIPRRTRCAMPRRSTSSP